MDTYVKPRKPVIDHRTDYSGVTAQHLEGCQVRLGHVQAELIQRLGSAPTFLVGHALDGDMRALRLLHPWLIDTALLFPSTRGAPFKRALRDLAHAFLGGRQIQQGHGTELGHDSYQDAATALELAMLKMLRGHDFCVPGPWSQVRPSVRLSFLSFGLI